MSISSELQNYVRVYSRAEAENPKEREQRGIKALSVLVLMMV